MGVGKLFESCKPLLWLCGIWPEDTLRHPLFSLLRLYFVASVQFLGLACFVVCTLMFSTVDNFPEYVIEFCALGLSSSKMLPLVRNRDQMINLISTTMKLDEPQKKDYHDKAEDEDDLEIARFWQKCGATVGKYLGLSYPTTVCVYSVLPFFAKGRALPLNIVFRQDSLVTPWFEVTYAAQTFLLVVFLISTITTDPVYVILICKLSEKHKQLERLLLRKSRNKGLGMKSRKDLLKLVIQRHKDIIKFGEELCRALSDAFLMQHFFSTVMLCFAAFMYLVTDSPGLSHKMIFVMVQGICLLFIICSAGEVITTRSDGLLEAFNLSDLSCSQLGELDAITLRQMVLVTLRAQKPLRLSVGTFGIINLDFFARTMKGAFSFFTVLRTVYA